MLALFILAFAVMIYGVIPWRTSASPADAVVVVPGDDRLVPVVLDPDRRRRANVGVEFTITFVDGARDLLGVALIIGIARGITVIMTNGLITDTVLNGAEEAVGGPRGVAFVILMYWCFCRCRS